MHTLHIKTLPLPAYYVSEDGLKWENTPLSPLSMALIFIPVSEQLTWGPLK